MPTKKQIIQAIKEAKESMKKNGHCPKIAKQIQRLQLIADSKEN
jgi:hypothetical protein